MSKQRLLNVSVPYGKVQSAADNASTAHPRRRAKRVDPTILLEGVRWQTLL